MRPGAVSSGVAGGYIDGHNVFRHEGTGGVWRKVEDLRFSSLVGPQAPFVVTRVPLLITHFFSPLTTHTQV